MLNRVRSDFPLVDGNIAGRERATGGIAVAQANGKRVRASVAAVICYTNAVGNSRSVAQPRCAGKVRTVPVEGQGAHLGPAD